MPAIIITTVEGRTIQEKQEMMSVVTDAVARVMDRDKEVIRVIINEIRPENYSLAGISFNDRRLSKDPIDTKNDVMLEIRIKAGRTPESVDSISDQLMAAVTDHPAFANGDIRVIVTELPDENFKVKFYSWKPKA